MKAACTFFISFFVAFNFAVHCYCERLNIMLISIRKAKKTDLASFLSYALLLLLQLPFSGSQSSPQCGGEGGSLLTGVLPPSRLEGYVRRYIFTKIALIYTAEILGYTKNS